MHSGISKQLEKDHAISRGYLGTSLLELYFLFVMLDFPLISLKYDLNLGVSFSLFGRYSPILRA